MPAGRAALAVLWRCADNMPRYGVQEVRQALGRVVSPAPPVLRVLGAAAFACGALGLRRVLCANSEKYLISRFRRLTRSTINFSVLGI